MFVWRGESHRHCTGWLFSWFIIINHCNDSFIQLVVSCVSGKLVYVALAANTAFYLQEEKAVTFYTVRYYVKNQQVTVRYVNIIMEKMVLSVKIIIEKVMVRFAKESK